MNDPRLLGVSAYRTDEIAKPIKKLKGSQSISVDHSKSFIRKYLLVFIRGNREISTGEYNAVVVNSPGLISFLMGILCLIHRIPLIIRLIGDYWWVSDIMVRRSLNELNITSLFMSLGRLILSKISFILADGCLVVSKELIEVVEQNTGIRRENISVVHYPVDFNKFASGNGEDFVKNHQINTERVLSVVFHAEFYPKYRGFKDVISLASKVLSDYPDISLVVAGWGKHYSRLSMFFRHDRIHFVGFVNNIADLYAATDILLYNSYMDGYPNVILEAQAAGVPVISNPKFGMNEQINHLNTGILAQVDGHYEDYLRDSLDGKLNIEELGRRAYQSVQEHNSPESISRDLSCAVKEIV